MVLEDAAFERMAQHMGGLIGCDASQLFLGCLGLALRHPLLGVLSIDTYRAVGGEESEGRREQLLALLQHEQIRALCDVALQTGQVQCCGNWQQSIEDRRIQSIAIVPLECPSGIMGFLLLFDHHTDAFLPGECLLLTQSMPQVARKLEAALYRQCDELCAPSIASGENAVESRSARRTSQLQRQALDRLKNDFIAMVSHELRSPLAAIKGYAALLQAYGLPEQLDEQFDEKSVAVMSPQRQREYLVHIMEQTKHLEVLINDLLDISRLHAGHLTLRYQHVDVKSLCRRVVQLIQQKYGQCAMKHAEIICTFAADVSLIWADPDRLQQVLTNLLDNAMKYSPNGGLIELNATTTRGIITCSDAPCGHQGRGEHQEQSGGPIAITVRDHGIGIAREQQSHLFKPFSRLEHALASEMPGAGLGLYITRKLVEAMEGRISLSSGEGKGTTVTFTLPGEAWKSDASRNKVVALTPI